MGTLRVEFLYDHESRNWHFRVPALHVVGGGAASRLEAERQCVEAVVYTLSGDPGEFDATADAVDMTVSLQLPAVA